MSKDLIGPAAFGAANPAVQRPPANPGNVDGAGDTWFLDCSSATARDGTQIKAGFLNFMLAQLRRAIRGMGVTENNTDDDMLLKAIQAAGGGGDLPAHTHPISQVTDLQGALDGKSPVGHTHDDRYYTEGESDGRFVRLNPSGGAMQTITGAGITIQGAWPTYNLQRTSDAQANVIYGRRAVGHAMWGLILGNGTSDDLSVTRWNVSGGYTDEPFRITYAGDTSIGVAGRTTTIQKTIIGDDRIELGVNNSGDRAAYIDFHASGAPQANDFSARILRNAGVNGTLELANTGTGGIAISSPVSLGGLLGKSGDVMKSNGTGSPPSWSGMADLQPQIQYDHVIAQGVTWTINTTNTWTKLPLNTLVANAIPGASVSAGTVTLPAGTYEVIGRVNQSVGAGTRWQGRVRNTSSNTTIAVTLLGGASGYEPITEHTAIGRFTLASASTIELQCYAENATNGAVQNIASGEPIILNSLTITKIG